MVVSNQAVKIETVDDGAQHGSSENRFAHGVSGTVSAQRIESQRRRSACERSAATCLKD